MMLDQFPHDQYPDQKYETYSEDYRTSITGDAESAVRNADGSIDWLGEDRLEHIKKVCLDHDTSGIFSSVCFELKDQGPSGWDGKTHAMFFGSDDKSKNRTISIGEDSNSFLVHGNFQRVKTPDQWREEKEKPVF